MTRTRRSLYSLAAMYLNTFMALVFGLLVTPLLFEWLGDERLGLVKMGQQWLGWSVLLSLGLDTALSLRYAKAQADGDRAEIVRVIRGALRAYFKVAMGGIIWVIVLMIGAEWFFNLNDSPLLGELRWALAVAMLGQIAFICTGFKPLAEAQQRGYMASISTAAGTFTSGVLAITLAYCGGGLPGQFAALTSITVVGGLLMTWDAVRRYPELLHRSSGTAAEAQRAFDPQMLIYQIAARVGFLSDAIVVGLLLGGVVVAQFTSTQGLMMMMLGILLGIGNATWGAFANLHHTGQNEAFNHRLIQLTRFTAILACGALVPAAVWNEVFVVAWVKEPARYGGDLLSYCTAAFAVLQCIVSLWGWPLVTLGHVRPLNRVLLVGVPLGLSSSLLLMNWQGPAGMTMGTILNMILVMYPGYALLLHRHFGTSLRKLAAAAFGPMLLAVPYAFALTGLAEHLPLEAWFPRRIVRMGSVAGLIGFSAAVFIPLAGYLLLPAADRREWAGRLFKRKPA